MKLHTRFRLVTLISIVSAAVIALTFALVIASVSKFIKQQKVTDEIGFLLVNQNLFGQEYVERHNDRSREQWWAAHHDLEKILRESTALFPSIHKQKLIERMESRLAISSDIFHLIETQQNVIRIPSVVEREWILSRQLSLIATVLIVDANDLSTLVRLDTSNSQRTLGILAGGAVLVIFLLAIWRSAIINKSVLYPIQELEKATSKVASGSLDEDLVIHDQDEIGQLASSFNEMNRTIRVSRESLLAMQRVLESKVKERTSALEKTNAELMRFVYVASHDLQEPLRVMVNYLQLLEAAKNDNDIETSSRYIDTAVRQGLRMKELIHALLEYTSVETSKMRICPVDASLALEQALSNLQTVIAETGAKIVAGKLPLVIADNILLTQVFQNLISNALKYRSEAAPIVIIEAQPDGAQWVFSVADNGIGIDSTYYKKIFEMFQRLHNRNKYAGTGIGLSICQKIIEQLGGRIWVESTVGQGSKFLFSLGAP